MRRTPLLILALTCLAGCSGTPDTAVPPTAPTDPSAAASRSSAAAVTTFPDGSSGALADLTRKRCTRDGDGPYSFTGTLTNTGRARATYNVTVSVVDAKTFAVQRTKEFTRTVEGKSSVDLSAPSFATPRGDTRCVVRVTRKTG